MEDNDNKYMEPGQGQGKDIKKRRTRRTKEQEDKEDKDSANLCLNSKLSWAYSHSDSLLKIALECLMKRVKG